MAPRGVSTWRRPYTSIYNDNYRYGTGLYSDTLTDIEKRYSESISKTHLRSDRPDLTFSTFSGSNLLSSPAPAEDSSSARETTRFSRQLSVSPTREYTRSPNFESRLNATLKSAAFELDEDVEDAINKRIEARKQALARSQSEIHSSKTEDEEDEEFRVRLERRKRALAKFQESRAESEEFATKLKKSTTTTTSVRDEEPLRPTSLYDDAALWTLPKSMEKISDIPKSRKKAGGRQTPTNGPSSQWRDKSRNLQDQLESLDKSMSDVSSRLRTDLSSMRSKYHTELSDLSGSVEHTTQQATDLQKLCNRQQLQLQELKAANQSVERNVKEALDQMDVWQSKCRSLKKEMDRLREEVEMAINKRSKA